MSLVNNLVEWVRLFPVDNYMMNRISRLILVVMSCSEVVLSQEMYRIVELSTPAPFVASAASDINDDGWVAGTVVDEKDVSHAVRWNRTSPPEILLLPGKFTNGFAAAIDGRGAVSGSAYKKGQPVGMSWRLATDFGRPEATNLVPVPLSAFSAVLDLESRPTRKFIFWRRDPSDFVGYRLDRKMQSHAIHVVNKRKHDHGAGVATCVNQSGLVGGYFSEDAVNVADGLSGSVKCIMEPSGVFAFNKRQIIMTSFEKSGSAGIFAVNNASTMVGRNVAGQDSRAFRWTWAGNQDVLAESLAGFGGAEDVALAANGLGVVVGRSIDTNGRSRAVRWMSDGSVVDLNRVIPQFAKWELLEARGVNRDGHIVGVGRKNGQIRGFAMQPALDECLITATAVQGGKNEVRTGETIVYDITYSNACNRTLEDVVVRQQAPNGTVNVRCITVNGDENSWNGEITGRLGTLQPGASGTISFSVRVIAEPGAMITNKHCTFSGRAIMTRTTPHVITPVTD